MFIVVKKVKDYIKSANSMNTSAAAVTVLSEMIKSLLDSAIIKAQEDGRKTVMDRDIIAVIQNNQKGEINEKVN